MTHTAKHTPGPYKIIHDNAIDATYIVPVVPHDSHALARVYRNHPEYEENAALFAAAPAMYEALREAHELIRSLVAEEMIHGTELQRVGNCQANMWSALAQAEGKQ